MYILKPQFKAALTHSHGLCSLQTIDSKIKSLAAMKNVANHWCQYLTITFKTKTQNSHSPKVECSRRFAAALPGPHCGNEQGSKLLSLDIEDPLDRDVEQLLLLQLRSDPRDLVVVGGHHPNLRVRPPSPLLGPLPPELRQPQLSLESIREHNRAH